MAGRPLLGLNRNFGQRLKIRTRTKQPFAVLCGEIDTRFRMPCINQRAAGYFAEQDAPILVSFAVNHPGGDRYLRQYIAIHSGYQYVQYRNRSLWIVLSNILRHPDPDWIRGTARELATTGSPAVLSNSVKRSRSLCWH
jgi:hypothetical protein